MLVSIDHFFFMVNWGFLFGAEGAGGEVPGSGEGKVGHKKGNTK